MCVCMYMLWKTLFLEIMNLHMKHVFLEFSSSSNEWMKRKERKKNLRHIHIHIHLLYTFIFKYLYSLIHEHKRYTLRVYLCTPQLMLMLLLLLYKKKRRKPVCIFNFPAFTSNAYKKTFPSLLGRLIYASWE